MDPFSQIGYVAFADLPKVNIGRYGQRGDLSPGRPHH